MYILHESISPEGTIVPWVLRLPAEIQIPYSPANEDYKMFKWNVLEGEPLVGLDGVEMTQEEANAYIATLP